MIWFVIFVLFSQANKLEEFLQTCVEPFGWLQKDSYVPNWRVCSTTQFEWVENRGQTKVLKGDSALGLLLLIETCPEVVQSSSVATSLLFRVATLKKMMSILEQHVGVDVLDSKLFA